MTGTRRTGRGAARIVAGLLSGLALLVLVPLAPAEAHARLVDSTPAQAAVLTDAPTTVVLTFDEPVRSVSKGFQLYDRAGGARSLTATATDRTVAATLPAGLHDGSYVLGWRVVSADSHPVSGALTFAVGQPDGTVPEVAPAAGSTSVTTTYAGLAALGYLALMTLVGLSVFEVAMLRSVADEGRARRRLRSTAGVVAPVVFALLVPLGAVRETGGELVDALRADALATAWRSAAGFTLLLVTLGSVLLVLARRLPRSGTGTVLTLVGSAVAMGSVLPVGHTRSHGPAWLVLGTDLVHAGAAAVWLGGLVGLSLFLRQARRSALDPRDAATVLGRFSTAAGAVVALLALSGTALAAVMLGSVRVLLDSTYGHVLLVKVGLAAVVGGLAVWNRAVLLPRLGRLDTHPEQWRRLVRAVQAEVAVLVLVVAATAVLGLQDPGAAPGGGKDAGSLTLTTELGSGHFSADLVPGRPGTNVLTFRLTDAADQPITPVAVPEVKVSEAELSLGPLAAEVVPQGEPGTYRATVTIPVTGQWRINTAVRVSEFEQPAAVVDVVVGS